MLDIGADPRPFLREKAKAKDARTRILTAALLFETHRLEKLREEYDYDALKAGLAEKDLDLRMQAAYALHQFHGAHVRPTTPVFLAGLKSKSPGVREQALRGLWMNASFDDKEEAAAPIVLDMYWNDPEPTVRKLARRFLVNVRFDKKMMIPPVTKMLRHENADVRYDGVNIVGHYGAAAVPLLAERCEDADPRVRKEAANALRYVSASGDNLRPALDQLRALTRHKDAEVRWSVLWPLGTLGKETWNDLLACLKDGNANVRDNAIYQLREQRGAPNTPTNRLSIALADLLKNHADPKVRLFAVESLERLDPEAFTPLFEAAKNDKDADVRSAALYRLGGFKKQSHAALPLLVAALKDESPYARRNAMHALSQIGPAAAAAIPDLIEAMKDKDEGTCQAAANALFYLGKECVPPALKLLAESRGRTRYWPLLVLRKHDYRDKKGLPILIACLSDPNDNVRWLTCLILEKMGTDAREAAPLLRKLAKGEDNYVAEAARDALKAIGEPAPK